MAAVTALVLHAGGVALAVAHLQNDDEDSVPGAQPDRHRCRTGAVERGEASELPPGPDSNASVAAPQLAEQRAEVKESELPQDKPTETTKPSGW